MYMEARQVLINLIDDPTSILNQGLADSLKVIYLVAS